MEFYFYQVITFLIINILGLGQGILCVEGNLFLMNIIFLSSCILIYL